jgi:putative membrane protein
LGFIAPGVSGVILAYNNALRLRMYKYDWLETQSGLSRKDARRRIPWDELLAEDKETLGPRDFKSFIFPWK